jgi:hypothetical protein
VPRGEADLDADAPGRTGAVRRLDTVLVGLLQHVRDDRAAAAHVPQDRVQVRPQFRTLDIGQRSRIPAQLQRTPGGLGRLGPDRLLNRDEQLFLVMEEPAAM